MNAKPLYRRYPAGGPDCASTRQVGGLVFRCQRPRWTEHEHHYHQRSDGVLISWRERLKARAIGG